MALLRGTPVGLSVTPTYSFVPYNYKGDLSDGMLDNPLIPCCLTMSGTMDAAQDHA